MLHPFQRDFLFETKLYRSSMLYGLWLYLCSLIWLSPLWAGQYNASCYSLYYTHGGNTHNTRECLICLVISSEENWLTHEMKDVVQMGYIEKQAWKLHLKIENWKFKKLPVIVYSASPNKIQAKVNQSNPYAIGTSYGSWVKLGCPSFEKLERCSDSN